MLIIEKVLNLPDTYPLTRIAPLNNLVFFDIETTGFSGAYHTLYLIGCTYYKNHQWHFIQWFADTEESEEELLHAFFSFLKPNTTLIHFNGDTFDLPFLRKRCEHFQLPYDFTHVISMDIYKKIKPYKILLGLTVLKQKYIEKFLGVTREDTYSGGELIPVYYNYLRSGSDYGKHLLLLHNEDDLKGMPYILPILNYCDLFEHPLEFHDKEIIEVQDLFGQTQKTISITYQSNYTLPIAFSHEKSFLQLNANGNQISFLLDCYSGTLHHYLTNYKDYYYLIHEDMVVHKSVGAYVEKSARKKATAQNCFLKKEGYFLPQPAERFHPLMKQERKAPISYVHLDDFSFDNKEALSFYAQDLLDYLRKK